MNYYVDIAVRPDPDFAEAQLMGALYAKLHRALVAQQSTRIGISLPDFDAQGPYLGTRLRLHASQADLTALLGSDWLTGMRDHVTLTPPAAVPDTAQHRVVRRVQVKSNPERLRRRLMQRQSVDEAQARARIPDESACFTQLPFVQLRSSSTGQSFRLFIEHGPLQPNAAPGEFNAYGLSQDATIAWF